MTSESSTRTETSRVGGINRIRVLLAGCLALACAGVAQAHGGQGLPGGFVQGFAHPFTGIDHLLAMVAVGIWGAFLGRPLIVALPVLFPVAMALGAVPAMAGHPMPFPEVGIAMSVLALGACVAFAARLPAWAAVALVAAFALFHGDAHGRELPSASDPLGYCLGFVLATGLLHLAGIGIGTLKRARGGTTAVRTLGTGIAAAGLWYLAIALS